MIMLTIIEIFGNIMFVHIGWLVNGHGLGRANLCVILKTSSNLFGNRLNLAKLGDGLDESSTVMVGDKRKTTR